MVGATWLPSWLIPSVQNLSCTGRGADSTHTNTELRERRGARERVCSIKKSRKLSHFYRTKQGSFLPLTIHSWSYFSFFLEGHREFTKPIPAWVLLISQYGESVSIIILSIGMPLTTSRFSALFSEQPFTPAI